MSFSAFKVSSEAEKTGFPPRRGSSWGDMLAQVAFIDVDLPKLQLALVQLALFHTAKEALPH